MIVAKQGIHTLAVIATLEALGLNVGDASGEDIPLPKAVVYDISDSTSGTFANPAEDTEFVYQVTCVGRVPAEARYVRDKAMGLLDGFGVTGHSIHVYKQDGSGSIKRDDDVTPPLYYCTPRFVVMSSPA